MTDIVERLRNAAYVEKNALLCATVAADEIERLRKDNEWLRNELEFLGLPKTDYRR